MKKSLWKCIETRKLCMHYPYCSVFLRVHIDWPTSQWKFLKIYRAMVKTHIRSYTAMWKNACVNAALTDFQIFTRFLPDEERRIRRDWSPERDPDRPNPEIRFSRVAVKSGKPIETKKTYFWRMLILQQLWENYRKEH